MSYQQYQQPGQFPPPPPAGFNPGCQQSAPPPAGFNTGYYSAPPPPSAAYPSPSEPQHAQQGGYYPGPGAAPFAPSAPPGGYPGVAPQQPPPPAGYPGSQPTGGYAPEDVKYDEKGQPMVYDRGLGKWILIGAATVAAGYAINHVVKKNKKGKVKKDKKNKKHKKHREAGMGPASDSSSSDSDDTMTETYINPHQQSGNTAAPAGHYAQPNASYLYGNQQPPAQYYAPQGNAPYGYPPPSH